MSIQVRLLRLGGPLSAVARSSQTSWGERHGLLIILRDEAGREGFGEASPLPAYSPDTIEMCWRVLEELPWDHAFHALHHKAPLDGLRALEEFISSDVPAARFGAETALGDLMAQREGVPLWRWLAAGSASSSSAPSAANEPLPRALCGLLSGRSQTEDLAVTEALFEQGIRTFKLKVGTHIAEELQTLRALRRQFGDSLKLRCDANQSLELPTAQAFLAELGELKLEFVEEPVKSGDLANLDSPVPLALDETLRADPRVARGALAQRAVRAVVLKPMVLGGFSACANWATRVASGQSLILSHLFDGPVALAAAAHAALLWGSAEMASGLSHHAGLGAWPTAKIGHLEATQIIQPKQPGLGVEWSVKP